MAIKIKANQLSFLLEQLHEQEIQIITLHAQGHSSAEIGAMLELSGRTVENKTQQLTKRFKAKNKTQLCSMMTLLKVIPEQSILKQL